ncbi:MAG: protein kinase, partial [Spirochaetaceae bacterium]|nr:protein kinase [Spirochaetaceae bacterium]
FMAPEQLEDARMADERSDMWSFGVCLFEMLTGRKFVTGPSPAAIREALPDAVRTMHQRLPPKLLRRLRRILRRTIRMKPDSRMKDGQAVLRLLRTARQAKNPPENLKERLQKLLASMDSVPDPTPAAEPAGNQDSRSFNLQSMFKLPRNIKPENVTKRKISLSGFQRITASLLIFFVLCLMVLIILPGAWNSAFRRNSFGSFRLKLTFPRETAESWLTGAETCIYREADGFLREVKTPRMKLSGSGLSMDSRRMTLAVGAYRLRWSLGDRVSWYSFYLPSIRENRESGIGILILEETLGDPPIFPLVFSWSVTDALSGGNLTGQTSMVWERLDKPGEILLSGGVYQFQFDAQGFQREVFDIAISPWRRNLSLHASLWPQPGSLTIQNNSGRLIMPRLDGSGQYLDMESSPRRHFIGRLKTGTSKKLILLPGRYLLTPGMGKSVVQDISVKNNENLTVIIESNEEKQLLIRVSPEE